MHEQGVQINSGIVFMLASMCFISQCQELIMSTPLEAMLDKMKALESELIEELQSNKKTFLMKSVNERFILKKTSYFATRNTLST